STFGVKTSPTSFVPDSFRLCEMNRYDRSTVRMPEALTPSCAQVMRKQLAEPQVARRGGANARTQRSTTPPRTVFRCACMRVFPVPPRGGQSSFDLPILACGRSTDYREVLGGGSGGTAGVSTGLEGESDRTLGGDDDGTRRVGSDWGSPSRDSGAS